MRPAILGAVVLLAACGSSAVKAVTPAAAQPGSTIVAAPTLSPKAPGTYTDAAQVAAALAAAGIPCSDFVANDPSAASIGPKNSGGNCTAGQFTLKISVYASPTDVAVAKMMGQGMMTALSVPPTPVVQAGDILIGASPVDVAATQDLLAAIAKVLHGSVVTLKPS